MAEDKEVEQVEIKFTWEEVELLQDLLVSLIENTDWEQCRVPSLMKARVLLDYDENVPHKIDKIYNKLF